MKTSTKKMFLSLLALTIIITLIGVGSLRLIEKKDQVGINCNVLKGLCIEMDINSYIDEFGLVRNKFGFPSSFRHGDYLRIDEIRIYNFGEKNISPFDIVIDIHPIGGHIKEGYSSNYGSQRITINQTLKSKDIYIVKREKYQGYNHFLNSKFIKRDKLHGIELYKTGEWIFDVKIELKKEGSLGYTILKEGRWKGDIFLVNPKHEIDTLIENQKMKKIALITLIAISIISIFHIWKNEFENMIWKIYKKYIKNYLMF